MKGSESSRDVMRRAALFAVVAFGLNMMAATGSSPFRVFLGDIALFVAAACSTPLAALVMAGLGVVPFALFIDSASYGIISSLIVIGIAVITRYLPRIPPYMAATAVWIFFVAPYAMIKGPPGWPQPWEAQAFLFFGLTSLLNAIVAGTLLLNPSILCRLSIRPRIPSALDLLLHVLPLCSMLSVLTLVALANRAGGLPQNALTFGHPAFLIGLLCVVIALPGLIACRLSTLLRHVDEPVVTGSGDLHDLTFSGRSSDYWKRAMADREYWAPQDEPRYDDGAPLSENSCSILLGPDLSLREVHGDVRLFGVTVPTGQHVAQSPLPLKISAVILACASDERPEWSKYREVVSRDVHGRGRAFGVAFRKFSSGELSVQIHDTSRGRILDPRIVSAQRLDTLGSLLSGVARAFSDGLTAIVARVSTAKRSTADQGIVSVLDEIENEARRSGAVVRLLLEFADGPESQKAITNLSDTVKEIGPLLTNLLDQPTSISVNANSTALFVELDRRLFIQALSNLLLNARDAYGVSGGNIVIRLDKEEILEESSVVQPDLSPGHYARLRVRDYAAGMSSDVLARAFDPLFTTRSEEGHSGMGLATVLAIVRSHGGFLTAESRPDRGTSITLYFPLVDVAPSPEAEEPKLKEASSNGHSDPAKTKVLWVEQRDERRRVISEMLSGLGYSVVDCRSPSEALELSRANPFDLVLLDEGLPGLVCDQFIEQLRDGAAGEPKALVLSPITDAPNENGYRRLAKPFGVEDLHEAINKTLH